MGENSLRWSGSAVGIAGIVATFAIGPIDCARSVYNLSIGDTAVMKNELVDYVRRGIAVRKGSPIVEEELSIVLRTNYTPTQSIDPQRVSTEVLWDASEDYAQSTWERWVWPSLKQ